MKKKLFSAVLTLASVAVSAQENPLWMRYPAISPDGRTIAFAYKGDIFTVDANVDRLNSSPPIRPTTTSPCGAPTAVR